jgi:hypothetical protein
VHVSRQAIEQRYSEQAAACLREVLQAAVSEVIGADPVAIPALSQFAAVAIYDSSTVHLPDELATIWRGCGERTGKGQAAVKLQVRLDLLSGRLDGPHLQHGRAHDKTSPHQKAALPVGALRIHDLGFLALDSLREAAQRGEYFLSRLSVQTAVFDALGERLNIRERLLSTHQDWVDLSVQLGAKHHLWARLLAVRVPTAVAESRRKSLQAAARHKSQPVSAARLELSDWTILITNVPAPRLGVAEALALYRARWQIELLFKLWKRHGQIDESASGQPWRRLCELYAKLLAMVIQHWAMLTGSWHMPARSMVQAAQVVRDHAMMLAHAMAGTSSLALVLKQIRQCLAVCRMNTRKREPNTYQLLLSLTQPALS